MTIAKPLIIVAAMALPGAALAADATANLMGPDGAEMGSVMLTQTPAGVLVSLDATGLPAGAHGFHIHQTGACTPDFAAAGDHFNPEDAEHGYMNDAGPHAGDMPNITVAEDGSAKADVLNVHVSLEEGGMGNLMDEDGSAIIIHENPDSYEAEAGAGGRIACGVIEASS